MRANGLILFIACFFWGSAGIVRAQSSIHGRVVNASTGKPLSDVNVYLSGTKMGTATNLFGQYQLSDVPVGGYLIVISIIGYQRKVEKIIVGHGGIKAINAKLKPVIYELPEIYVGDLNKKWKRNLEWFTKLFIGKTEWADSVKILNPEVLRFHTNWTGNFKAEALAPLEIENRALGYHITYQLDAFTHYGGLTRWDGDPLFKELTPSDSLQAFHWMQNRKKAFYGSLRHFLLALLGSRLDEEGFILYNIRQPMYGFSPKKSFTPMGRSLFVIAQKILSTI